MGFSKESIIEPLSERRDKRPAVSKSDVVQKVLENMEKELNSFDPKPEVLDSLSRIYATLSG